MRDNEKILAKSEAINTRAPAWTLLLLVCPTGLLILYGGIRGFSWKSPFSIALLQMLFGAALLAFGLVGFELLRKAANTSVTVTTRTVTGCDGNNRPFFIPIDGINEVKQVNGGVSFSTASGNYFLPNIKNCSEICGTIQRLLNARSEPSAPETGSRSAAAPSAADEIEKFKRLLDMGAITQEEYDAKKKQLLGLDK